MKKLILILSLICFNSANSMVFPTEYESFWIENFPNIYTKGTFAQFNSKFNLLVEALILKSRFLIDYDVDFAPHFRSVLTGFYAKVFNVENAKYCDFGLFAQIVLSKIIESIEASIKTFGFFQMRVRGLNFCFSIIIDNATARLIIANSEKLLAFFDLSSQLHDHLKIV